MGRVRYILDNKDEDSRCRVICEAINKYTGSKNLKSYRYGMYPQYKSETYLSGTNNEKIRFWFPNKDNSAGIDNYYTDNFYEIGDKSLTLREGEKAVLRLVFYKINAKSDYCFKGVYKYFERKDGFNIYHRIADKAIIYKHYSEIGIEYYPESEKTFKFIPQDVVEENSYIEAVVEETTSRDYVEYQPVPVPNIPGEIVNEVKRPIRTEAGSVSLRRAHFQCECNPAHQTFTSKRTGMPYVEPHHIIPLAQQDEFVLYSLDVPANIVSLCPSCHKCIHYGKEGKEMLNAVYTARKDELAAAGIGITLGDLYTMYGFNYLVMEE